MISPSKWIAGAFVLAACAFSSFAVAADADSRADDDAFLLLRDAARQDDVAKADFYADRLTSYSIPSYVDYYRLKPRLKLLNDDQFRDFLNRYQGSAIADRFRNDWLLELGRKRDWATFDEQYPQFVLNDDTQLKCYALMSRVQKGERVAADARALLVAPPGYGEACGSLITALAQSGQFDSNDLYAQLRLAGETNATGPARRTMLLLGGSDARIAQAIDLPALALAKGAGISRAEHETYIVALGRMARSSLKLAVLALDKAASKLSAQERAIAWATIALPASQSLAPEASDYWLKSEGAPLSIDQMLWKTRIALRDENWPQVMASIRAMPDTLRNDPAWVYWLGRALKAEGSGQVTPDAAALFSSISDQNNFYGLLSLEELGRQVSIPPAGRPITQAEIAAVAANPGFQRALKFFGMRLRFEGTREWNWELRKMSERQHLAAAEFARQNNILDRMVNTSDRTRIEVDYTQRYPSPHDDVMSPATQTLGLDKAWVYGLIRQESRFIMDAQSHVGASGLMQVMPSTGRYVAKKIGLTDFVQDMLSDVRTNVLLGTNYLNMVLGGLDGSQVLASAAYNAGPGRLRIWRATMTRPLEGAIFAETIPYAETRTYVKNVMTNATYYAALFENRPQSLKMRLGTVGPKGTNTANTAPADLP
ncbi:transglycosylase SLT domain protein [Janthinobacterium agaricidamnosum NBRC 102515 = DSM 9628]|uniref:Transglycosylase SLT domain protein n=1 Tax=Janthinobacterium agaricidamnosum NBRC 102515 = DSM 9628 TaxID=1349767 RepID=W0V9Y4_9BURK|nr:lytic transglycosylase domain-containing protein [Janthinobacterium agaricidamnosum]CDG85629.1 transglycosylase SLT domain protein [Janthinobacterium agaricidamnosum NBRC 102515 = DSM 9628]